MKVGALSSILSPVRFFSAPVITVHVESSSVRLLVVRDRQITDWGVEPLEPGLVRDGVATDPQAVGMRVRSLLASHHIRNGKLVVSLTGQRSVPRILDLPEMSSQLLQEVIPREMKREMPVPLDDMHLSWQIIRSENGHLRVFALGVPRDALGPMVEVIKLSGRKPRSMDIKPLCLVRAVGRRDALIADLEHESVDVIVVRSGIPATVRTVSLGPEAAEVEDKVRRLGEELARTVKFHSDTHQEDPLPPATPVCLTGSLAEEVASSGVVERSIGYPVEPLALRLDRRPDLPTATFMVNIGLALKET
jgi:hypothetical protein